MGKPKAIEKSRFFYIHKECNAVKYAILDALQAEYVTYLRICVSEMLAAKKLDLKRPEYRTFFPRAEKLNTNFQGSARDHAVGIIRSWASSKYTHKLKDHISKLKKDGDLTKEEAKILYTIGKHSVWKAYPDLPQSSIDFYISMLFDADICGKLPSVSDNAEIRTDKNTCNFGSNTEEEGLADYWVRLSTLNSCQRIWLPLEGNKYIKSTAVLSKGFKIRKIAIDKWRLEALDYSQEWLLPEVNHEKTPVAIDAGKNVIAADSEGVLYGTKAAPIFDKKWGKIKQIRANRQRQGLKAESGRLSRLESNLKGFLKTEIGTVANKLVKTYGDRPFLLEDLHLDGTKGPKRWSYSALAESLSSKVKIKKVNPAYTSQRCPSCGYFNPKNRNGTKFKCRVCGKTGHADVIGARGILRCSELENITCDTPHESVREYWARLYWSRRNPGKDCPPNFFKKRPKKKPQKVDLGCSEPVPTGPELTTGGMGFTQPAQLQIECSNSG